METIELKHPFEVDGQTIETVTLRRPRLRDIEKSQKHDSDLARSIHLIADLAELTPDQVREMDVEDFQTVSARLGEWLGTSG